jgi:DNA repair exonuclease SbcCD ATPase subunit
VAEGTAKLSALKTQSESLLSEEDKLTKLNADLTASAAKAAAKKQAALASIEECKQRHTQLSQEVSALTEELAQANAEQVGGTPPRPGTTSAPALVASLEGKLHRHRAPRESTRTRC